jgi:hypothetical protein
MKKRMGHRMIDGAFAGLNGNVLVTCVDDNMGMVFNGRRVSRDVAVCRDVLSLCCDGCLHMDAGTLALFQGLDLEGVRTCGTEETGVNMYFLEKPEQLGLFSWDCIVLYAWNRRYPSDGKFSVDLSSYGLAQETEFQGNSHEKITRRIYLQKKC